MSTLFESTTIKDMTLRNRIVRSATWEGMCAPDGRPTRKLADFYAALARGGVGLIITSYTFVLPEGKQLAGQAGIHSDDFASDYRRLTQSVHDAGGVVAVQLVHAGGQADPEQAGRQTLAPSRVRVSQFLTEPAELSTAQIREIISAFGRAAGRARAWGFDGVQLHGAHGYLINQFLSPLTNRRTDGYGGGIENRCRFVMQVYGEVRRAVGEDYPVMIKLNAEDNLEGGLKLADACYAARQLDKAGIDAIEVSAGTPASEDKGPARTKIDTPEKEAYNLEPARRIKSEVSCPVITVGGFRSYEVAENAVRNAEMDYIAMARPLVREPGLPNRWLDGDRSPAYCISCNKCFMPALKKGGIYCVVEKKEQKKKQKRS